jgi:hypothetical protein
MKMNKIFIVMDKKGLCLNGNKMYKIIKFSIINS